MIRRYHFIGWSRGRSGNIVRYLLKDVCNTITSFCGGGIYKDKETDMYNTTPYILIEYEA